MKHLKILCFILLAMPCFLQAQFVNYGIIGGAGLGGPKGEGWSDATGVSPELGWFVQYNWKEKISFRTFVNLEYHKFILTGGKQVMANAASQGYSISDAPDYHFGAYGASQHFDISYKLLPGKLDVSAGAFWRLSFTQRVNPDQPRIFYAASDEEILTQPYSPEVFQTQLISDSYTTDLYASDQIQHGFRDVYTGLYASVTGGTEHLKLMLRYDYSWKNFYAAYSPRKLSQNYLTIGLIYFYNRR